MECKQKQLLLLFKEKINKIKERHSLGTKPFGSPLIVMYSV